MAKRLHSGCTAMAQQLHSDGTAVANAVKQLAKCSLTIAQQWLSAYG